MEKYLWLMWLFMANSELMVITLPEIDDWINHNPW